jgi:hypothetical protein
MTGWLIWGIVVALVVGLDLGGRAQRYRSRKGWLEKATRRRLVVHTTDDQSIAGLLDTVGPDGILLRSAKLLGSQGVELAGEVWVDRIKIRFVQMLP